MSVNSYLGNELSHRDDLESLTYLLIYLLHGSLLWFNGTQLWQSTIFKMKQSASAEDMCKTFTPEFAQFLEYSYTLSFTEKLDYTCFQSSFWNVLTMSGPPIFDWQASGFFLVDLDALDVLHGAPMKNMHLEHHNGTTLKNPKRYVRLQLMVHTTNSSGSLGGFEQLSHKSIIIKW